MWELRIFSNILESIGRDEIGRKLPGDVGSPFLNIGVTSACL